MIKVGDYLRFPVKTVAVDFGAIPQPEATFTFSDTDITQGMNIHGWIAGTAPVNKDLDELEMDTFAVTMYASANGQGTVRIVGLEGFLADQFNVAYQLN